MNEKDMERLLEVGVSKGKCFICTNETNLIEVNYQCYICSEGCLREMDDEFRKVYNRE